VAIGKISIETTHRASCIYRPAAESRYGGLCVVFLFLVYLFIFPVRPIISKSTGPVFAKFSELVELRLYMTNMKLVFRSLKGRCCGNQFFLFLSTEQNGCRWM